MTQPSPCLHCGSAIPAGSTLESFCCTGCQAVYGLLREEGLTRYYDIARGDTAPVAEAPGERSYAWLEPLLARSEEGSSPVCSLELDVQGVHCAACVWLMNELFRRQKGGASFTVNPALGKVQIAWARDRFDLRRFLSEVERFGYLFGPSRKQADRAGRALLLRLGLCAALAMNVMMFSVSFYVGLAPEEEQIFRLFSRISLGLSTLVVLIGGWPFIKSAWAALRRGMLHLDLPIAVGILLAYGLSLWQARGGRGDLAYFDTLNTFVTLMLTGRWVQQRVLDRNRRFLLEDDGADGIMVRRRVRASGATTEEARLRAKRDPSAVGLAEAGLGDDDTPRDALVAVPAPRVRKGDHLVIAPGDLVPVDAQLLDAAAAFSTDWITGEAEVREMARGGTVPAGAFLAGRNAVAVLAATDFADSPLPALLRSTVPETEGKQWAHARFWDRLARIYVLAVLGLAALGCALWWPTDPEKALQITVALLVVTCPCAIGIAIPLAYELVQARLRRGGFFVRKQELLDKLPRVRKVLFDKTGTLTLGRLHLEKADELRALSPELRDAAYDMAARSNHPVSRCIAAELAKAGARFDADAAAEELPGKGLQLERGGRTYRLGKASWAAPEHDQPAATVLAVADASGNHATAAVFRTAESVRADARREIAALREGGIDVWLVSGDAPAKVASMAAQLGVDAENALGGQRPEDKAAVVAHVDAQDTLFVGDGVNDSLAFERAFCAGTPAVDRPVLPGKADFFLLGEGIAGIREALALAAKLHVVVRRNLVVALAYNVLSVATCLAGWMTPLRAAVFMPISSLTVILVTIASLQAAKRREAKRQPIAREATA